MKKNQFSEDFNQTAFRTVQLATSENPQPDHLYESLKCLRHLLSGFKVLDRMNEKEKAIFIKSMDELNINKNIQNPIHETLKLFEKLFIKAEKERKKLNTIRAKELKIMMKHKKKK